MPQFFISYSRVDTPVVEALWERLGQIYGYDNVWYDRNLRGGDHWWDEILNAVAACDVFIYLLSNESVQSPYCLAEFEEAQRLQKRVITVQVRDRTNLPPELGDIQYVDLKRGVEDSAAITRLFAAINKQIEMIPARKPRPLWTPQTARPGVEDVPETRTAEHMQTPTLHPPPAQVMARRQAAGGRNMTLPLVLGGGFVALVLLGVVAVLYLPQALTTIAPADAAETATPDGPTGIVNLENLPNTFRTVYSGPSTGFSRVGEAEGGEEVVLLAQNSGGMWLKINYPPGSIHEAWIWGAAIEADGVDIGALPEENPPPHPSATPNPMTRTASAIEAGTRFAQWTAEAATPTPQATVDDTPRGVANTAANVRVGPGTVYSQTGFLVNGQAVDLVAVNSGRSWYKIRYNEGTVGWVASYLLDASGDTTSLPVENPAPPTATDTPVPPSRTPTPSNTPAPVTLQFVTQSFLPGQFQINSPTPTSALNSNNIDRAEIDLGNLTIDD